MCLAWLRSDGRVDGTGGGTANVQRDGGMHSSTTRTLVTHTRVNCTGEGAGGSRDQTRVTPACDIR
jgi:hypothetical protein